MATGRTISFHDTSDMIYNYTCSACDEDGKNAEATFFCTDCNKLFCDPCVNLHNKILRHHSVLGKEDMAKWSMGSKATGLEICERHKEKELEMYCRDHDKICCTICISVDHRMCKVLQHLPDVADGIRETPDFKTLITQVTNIQAQLADMKEAHHTTVFDLQKTCQEIKITISNVKEKFIKLLNDLEKQTNEQLDRIYARLEAKLKADTDYCNDLIESFKTCMDAMVDEGKTTESLAYIGYKNCQDKLVDAENHISDMSKQKFNISYNTYPKIGVCLTSLTTLGKISTVPDLEDTWDRIYRVTNKHEHSVTMQGDTKQHEIWGCCQLPDGHLIILDSNNHKVKLMNEQFTILDSISYFPLFPNDICNVSNCQVVISLGDRAKRREIQYMCVSSNGKLVRGKQVQLDHVCGGIAFNKGVLYISSNTALYIYTKDGKLVKKVYEDTSGKWTIHKFALSEDGRMIYITNMEKNMLITLDLRRNVFANFIDPKLKRPTGVCVADNGTVLVCGYDSATVIQVDHEGRNKLADIASYSDGIYAPYSLLFVRKSAQLIIGQVSDSILVFDMA